MFLDGVGLYDYRLGQRQTAGRRRHRVRVLPSSDVGFVTLTVVHDEAEAEMLCGMLRANGVGCSYRKTDVAAGAWTGGFARSGPVEVVVDEHDAAAARELLPHR